MKRILLAASFILASVAAMNVLFAQGPTAISVVRDAGCGCCLNWVAHLRKAGFTATVTESANMNALKDQRGVPAAARSCHTAMVLGYVIEGHVPAADIQRLLKERPDIAGLAVPGMPAGSPGMETGGAVQPYDVLAFDRAGKTRVFASHR